MKTIAAIAFFIAPFWAAFSQNEPVVEQKGAKPIAASPADTARPTVRALVVGISDYANDGIKDLRFADRDAQVFHDFLRSKAGGEVPEENILLRTNKQATQGMLMDDLNFLTLSSKKGDVVIIYFSGHGDVEKQTLWQLGYLLCYDTPFNNYPNNAVELEFLNKVVTTLSVGVQAKVIVILDACHSGKLAGAENLGPSLTAKQAAIQQANEVRILSCQSDQLSVESERWGGGRGVFSYFLINGLKGLADTEGDGDVLFYELKNHLRSSMRKAIQEAMIDNEQTAVFVGQDEYFKLANVDPATLASVKEESTKPPMLAASAPMVGTAGTKDVAAVYEGKKSVAPAQKQAALDAFSEAVDWGLHNGRVFFSGKKGDLLEEITGNFSRAFARADTLKEVVPVGGERESRPVFDEATRAGIGDFIELSKKAKKDAALRDFLKTKVAVRLHDIAQRAITAYLEGDAAELARRYFTHQAAAYGQYPLMLRAAADLLPEGHPLRPICEVKAHYFSGVCIRLAAQLGDTIRTAELSKAMVEQRAALALDPHAAYVHNEIGVLHYFRQEYAAARDEFRQAADLSPSWAVAFSNVAAAQFSLNQPDSARLNAEKAARLDPNYAGAALNLGLAFELKGDLLRAETEYRRAKKLNDRHFLPYERLANLQLKTGRYAEADHRFKEMEERRRDMLAQTKIYVLSLATPLQQTTVQVDAPFPPVNNLIENPLTAEDFFRNGLYYFQRGRNEEAERSFNRAVKLDPKHVGALDMLSSMLFHQKRWGEAEICLLRLAEMFPESGERLFKLVELYQAWGRPEREEDVYRQVITNVEEDNYRHEALKGLQNLLRGQGRFLEEEQLLLRWRDQKLCMAEAPLFSFYHDMKEAFPKSADWLYKYADFNFNNKESDQQSAAFDFEGVIELDTAYPARAFLENRIGQTFLKSLGPDPWALGNEKFEPTEAWLLSRLEDVEGHLEQATSRQPDWLEPRTGLAAARTLGWEYGEAVSTLEKIEAEGRLDYENLMRLADLRIRSGKLAEGYEMLKKGLWMQPEPIEGQHEAFGKLEMLRGGTAAALDNFMAEFNLDPSAAQPETCYTIARLHARLGHRDAALDWLSKAAGAGFNRKFVVRYDPDWARLRGDARFMKLEASIQNLADKS